MVETDGNRGSSSTIAMTRTVREGKHTSCMHDENPSNLTFLCAILWRTIVMNLYVARYGKMDVVTNLTIGLVRDVTGFWKVFALLWALLPHCSYRVDSLIVQSY